MVKAKKVELIMELRQLRKQKQITYQHIADVTEQNGEAVSLSTIKKVFNEKELFDHDYNTILRPISDALMEPGDDDSLEIKVLQTRLSIKDEVIRQLQERLAAKDNKYRDREEFYKEQIDFYKDQIRFKDDQIKRFAANIDRKDAMLRKYIEGDITE